MPQQMLCTLYLARLASLFVCLNKVSYEAKYCHSQQTQASAAVETKVRFAYIVYRSRICGLLAKRGLDLVRKHRGSFHSDKQLVISVCTVCQVFVHRTPPSQRTHITKGCTPPSQHTHTQTRATHLAHNTRTYRPARAHTHTHTHLRS